MQQTSSFRKPSLDEAMMPVYGIPSPFASTYAATCRRILDDFTALPGLRLTAAQAQRLWHLEAFACEAMLGAFVDAGFLSRDSRGVFARSASDVRQAAPSPAPQ